MLAARSTHIRPRSIRTLIPLPAITTRTRLTRIPPQPMFILTGPGADMSTTNTWSTAATSGANTNTNAASTKTAADGAGNRSGSRGDTRPDHVTISRTRRLIDASELLTVYLV